jgi:dihydrodipicolinate reductase
MIKVGVIGASGRMGRMLIEAVLAAASGRAVVPMDADLQHPPEALAELVVLEL